MKKFIFNADDLGISKLTTDGILACSEVVKSASLMVTSDNAEYAFTEATKKEISVGIHLNVSGEGNFLTDNSDFGKNGPINKAFKDKEKLTEKTLDKIFSEFSAQLNLFKTKFGNPSHINFHHPLYLIPNFNSRFREFIENEKIPTRWYKDLGSTSIPHPDHTEFGFFNTDELTLNNILKLMDNAPEGVTEFVIHPGFIDKTLNSSYKLERQKQVDVLTNNSITKHIIDNGWKLINFDDIRWK